MIICMDVYSERPRTAVRESRAIRFDSEWGCVALDETVLLRVVFNLGQVKTSVSMPV